MRGLENIWWIASYPKSGNTWVRLFLNAYNFGNGHINSIATSIGENAPEYIQACTSRPLHELSDAHRLALRPAALLQIMAFHSMPGVPLRIKTHCFCDKLGFVIPPFLTNGAIQVVRDPRDVCVSFSKHLGVTFDQMIALMNDDGFSLGNTIPQPIGTWSGNVMSWSENAEFPVLVVRYEDMISEPERVFAEIVQFSRLPLHQKVLEQSIADCDFDRLRQQEDQHGFMEKGRGDRFFRTGTSGGWQDVLTRAQAEQIERDHEQVMRKFGYIKAPRPAASSHLRAAMQEEQR